MPCSSFENSGPIDSHWFSFHLFHLAQRKDCKMVETRPVGCGLRSFWLVWFVFVLSLFFSPPSDCSSLPSTMTWAPCPHGVRTRGKKKTGKWGQGTGGSKLGTGTWDRELGQLEQGTWGQGTGTGNLGRELGQQTGDRELGTGNWGQGWGQETLGGREQGTWDRELGTGTGERELGRELGTGNWRQQTGDRELGTGNWGQGTGGGTGGQVPLQGSGDRELGQATHSLFFFARVEALCVQP